jgi:hypothetical protein
MTGAVAVLLASGCAQPADVGKPSPSFWGVVPQGETGLAQLRRLHAGGVGSIRIGIAWPNVAPRRHRPPEWRDVDRTVADATRADMAVLPFVTGSPRWVAGEERILPVGSRRQRNEWASFLRSLVHRYGPRGAFWKTHPGLPERAIRSWQIWNEPNFFYFAKHPSPSRYARLVALSHRVLSAADRGAHLILAGMFALPRQRPPLAYPAYRFLSLMYRRDPSLRGRGIVDGVAIHPYTADFRDLTPILNRIRGALRRVGASSTPLWITEIGWGSQSGRSATDFEKGRLGQTWQLRGAFRLLLRHRADWRLRGVFWFTVADSHAPGICNFCDSAGLFTSRLKPKPAWTAYRQIALASQD